MDRKMTVEQVLDIIVVNRPCVEIQQDMIDEIKRLLDQGITEEQACNIVLGKDFQNLYLH
ncbi:hypothetical protein C2869_12955 [Saccharobesus litoralis]|uniref:Uncharacterized protein n=1 Tax=Saccharobesus litoralis TaxID=2172099 RepID=A0A2S0VSV6_9ALTE|nr:hypothetical protein [Saccharobesus litoralis]AWB67294.1 hypothetical protein C2869_12955 [Saccharobesus litoralis]